MLAELTSNPLPSVISEYLTEWAVNHNRPIRVVEGMFSIHTPSSDWGGPARNLLDSSLSQQFLRESGITIVNWGSMSDFSPSNASVIPGDFYVDGADRTPNISDWMVPQSNVPHQALFPIRSISGLEICEVGENTIWYFTSLPHITDPDSLDLDKILGIPLNKCIDQDLFQKIKEEQSERNSMAYAKLLVDGIAHREPNILSEMLSHERALSSYQSQINSTIAVMRSMKQELEAVRRAQKDSELDIDFYKAQYQAITNHPLIKKDTLSIEDNGIQFDTVELYIDEDILIGDFRINIDVNSMNTRIENKTNSRNGRDHPHIESTAPCWGGYQSEVIRYMERRDISGFIEFLFGFLQTYNPDDDWGRYIAYWDDSGSDPDNPDEEPY